MSIDIKKKTNITMMGNIGVGKTSTLIHLQRYGISVAEERFIDSDILDDFYKDMKNNSFIFQLQVLNDVCERSSMYTKTTIFERGLEDGLFVFSNVLHEEGNITNKQLEILHNLYNHIDRSCKSDKFIYLRGGPETCMSRILSRGRECEKNITLEYLTKIHNQYEDLVNGITYSNILIIDAELTVEENVVKILEFI